jgi:hypothetical protein
MSYFLFDAFARFIIALLLIPLIIYIYTRISTPTHSNYYGALNQLVHLVYVFFLIFLTDDLFFKFMYLRDEFKQYLLQNDEQQFVITIMN